ncbi:sensor histidine kinase [Actinophytocola algeriensis]|uniref:histidine kinase n=1 Tax=Actinophytocola algeriensis TaxID=1768010 RepID=A0A7W7VDN0_9PSEU|nr:sensor histidine kinase [Actinophytocola algeriensis]MBB4906327.1 signal transduction histidine kinase [Actinophytocola algeriensis]MBE1477808.1 signal transduction histidine kinase [Actinophytocola algeriensis]
MTTYRTFSFGTLHPLAIVVPISFVQVVFTFGAAYGQGVADRVNALTIALVLASAVALTWRRSHPIWVLAAVYVLEAVYFALKNPFGPIFISLVVALFNATAHGTRAPAWTTGYVGAVVLFVAMLSRNDWVVNWVGAGAVLAWISLVMGIGELAKARRDRAAQAEEARAEQDKRQASEERLKIAREVHDVLAHHVSLINVQSGVALHLIDSQPEQVKEALTAIKQSSKEVLVELRNILGVLRDVDGRDSKQPRHPVASLDQLDRLVERMDTAGLPVTVEVDGEKRPVPKGVDAAALRIVQESLTNTYRHAGPTSATVTLGYRPAELTVQVDDEGRGSAESSVGTGSGLTGMRQRVEALSGTFAAGPKPGGGFRVTARFPTGGGET